MTQILGIIAYFCIRSGIEANAALAHGQAGVIHVLVHHRLGTATAMLIGIGLISFGLFELAVAKYGRVPHREVKKKVHDMLPRVKDESAPDKRRPRV